MTEVVECPSCHVRTVRCSRCDATALMGTRVVCANPICGASMMCAGCGMLVDLAGRGMERADGELLPWTERSDSP